MLELDPSTRQNVWRQVTDAVERFNADLPSLPVAPSADPELARALLKRVDFETPLAPSEALALVVEGLRDHQVHTGHPNYFGLFNPAVAPMGVAADTLVAAFNPQLAAWKHAPFPCEVEELMTKQIGARLGYPEDRACGSFTSGGAEANHTALLMALSRAFPGFRERGVRSLPGQPTVYVSGESHHSFIKAARFSGLGDASVHHVSSTEDFAMDPGALERQIEQDRARGDYPFLIVATLGTTGAAVIDPVGAAADVGERQGLWVHADAAWAGAAALLPEMRETFTGLERADSITFDAHKWLSAPMAAGMFLTRHRALMEPTFAVDAGYMPVATGEDAVVEPHRVSIQWTHRFIGLKVFLSFLVAGWDGYEKTIREMIRLGGVLKRRLGDEGWRVVNDTPLPVACFQDERSPDGASAEHMRGIVDRVEIRGKAWVSFMNLGGSMPAARACITNFRNTEASIETLLEELDEARRAR